MAAASLSVAGLFIRLKPLRQRAFPTKKRLSGSFAREPGGAAGVVSMTRRSGPGPAERQRRRPRHCRNVRNDSGRFPLPSGGGTGSGRFTPKFRVERGFQSMPRPSPGSLPPPRKPVSASVKSQTRQGGPASQPAKQPETPEDFRMLQQRIADAVSRQHRLCAAKQACEAELSRPNKTRRLNGHGAALASPYDDQ